MIPMQPGLSKSWSCDFGFGFMIICNHLGSESVSWGRGTIFAGGGMKCENSVVSPVVSHLNNAFKSPNVGKMS